MDQKIKIQTQNMLAEKVSSQKNGKIKAKF